MCNNYIELLFIRSFFIYLFIYNSKREPKEYMCPVESFSKEVFNLPRHLRSKRRPWSKESAKFALNQFNMRKKYQFATTCKLASPKKVKKRLPQKAYLSSGIVHSSYYENR